MDDKKRVLVADDEPAVLRFVRLRLTLAGFEVITATSGEEALQLAEGQKPDIILLDLLMAPLSGFEVLSKLRKFSQVPVIVFTAQSHAGDKALNAGANGYIAKPFRPGELINKVNEVLALDNASGLKE